MAQSNTSDIPYPTHGPTAPFHLLNDGFDHEAYNIRRCAEMNQMFCKKGETVLVPQTGPYGPSARYVKCVWTEEDKNTYEKTGKLPISSESRHGNEELTIVFAQMRAWSRQYPGMPDDLGHPMPFLRIGHAESRLAFIFEIVDAAPDEETKQDFIAFVPVELVDTTHRRRVNEEFRITRRATANPIVFSERWIDYVAHIANYQERWWCPKRAY